MVNFDVNLKHFRKLLGCSMTVGRGHFNRVLYNREDGILFKVNKRVYNNFCPDYGQETYDEKECLRSFSHTIDVDQLEYFSNVQKNISLTKLPYGLIRCEGINAGVLLPYHYDYFNMGRMLLTNKELLKYLEMLLERIRELELNKIVQTDLACNFFSTMDDYGRGDLNIVINSDDMQLIDLDGDFVKYNTLDQLYSMYIEFIKVLDIYNDLNNLHFTLSDGTFYDCSMNYEKAKSIFDNYKKML